MKPYQWFGSISNFRTCLGGDTGSVWGGGKTRKKKKIKGGLNHLDMAVQRISRVFKNLRLVLLSSCRRKEGRKRASTTMDAGRGIKSQLRGGGFPVKRSPFQDTKGG